MNDIISIALNQTAVQLNWTHPEVAESGKILQYTVYWCEKNGAEQCKVRENAYLNKNLFIFIVTLKYFGDSIIVIMSIHSFVHFPLTAIIN